MLHSAWLDNVIVQCFSSGNIFQSCLLKASHHWCQYWPANLSLVDKKCDSTVHYMHSRFTEQMLSWKLIYQFSRIKKIPYQAPPTQLGPRKCTFWENRFFGTQISMLRFSFFFANWKNYQEQLYSVFSFPLRYRKTAQKMVQSSKNAENEQYHLATSRRSYIR